MRDSAANWPYPVLAFFMLSLAVAGVASAAAVAYCDPDPVAAPQAPQAHEESQGSVRESDISRVSKDAPTPQIGFIDSPTVGCYQPDPAQDVCYITWYYLAVDASPNYMICMQVEINAIGKVAYYQGFFATSLYAPYNMQGQGFRVSCGSLGAGGISTLGNSYAWTIRARDSAGLRSANYGTAYCPAYTP